MGAARKLAGTSAVPLLAAALLSTLGACAAPAGEPRSAEAAFGRLEQRLLEAPGARIELRAESAGAFASDLSGELALGRGNRARLLASGRFGRQEVELDLACDGERMRGGTAAGRFDESAPPALREALVIGLTRMGVLHNLARLATGQSPDRAMGGAREWVEVSSLEWADAARTALRFEITVSGTPSATATLWLDPATGLPSRREQTVRFPGGEMSVVETYRSFHLGAEPEPGRFRLEASP